MEYILKTSTLNKGCAKVNISRLMAALAKENCDLISIQEEALLYQPCRR